MFCCVLRCVHSSFAIILMGKKELAALLSLSFWYLVIIVWLKGSECHGLICSLCLWCFLITLTIFYYFYGPFQGDASFVEPFVIYVLCLSYL